jgi:hypothetical protein
MHDVSSSAIMATAFVVALALCCLASRPAVSEAKMPDSAKTELLWPNGAPGTLGHAA